MRLASTREIQPGEEIYVRHAPGVIQWDCFHPIGCTSGMLVLSDRTLPITPNSFCGLLFFLLSMSFLSGSVIGHPYDYTHCVKCTQCYRGIHLACLSDPTDKISCSFCTGKIKRQLPFTDEIPESMSPALRWVLVAKF